MVVENMAGTILCKICGKRRAKRACPAVAGDICPICCGEQREVSLSCPLDCEYLQEAHEHEKALPVAEEEISNPDIRVAEQFVAEQEELVLFCISSSLADYGKLRSERESLPALRNTDILKTLVFLHRVGQQNLNGRPKGRLYIGLLRQMTPDKPVDERAPSIII